MVFSPFWDNTQKTKDGFFLLLFAYYRMDMFRTISHASNNGG